MPETRDHDAAIRVITMGEMRTAARVAMPDMRVGGGVRVVTWPKKNLFAVTLEGEVFVSAKVLDDVELAELVRRKDVFVGVRLQTRELRLLLHRLRGASSEAAAFISGARLKRRRSR